MRISLSSIPLIKRIPIIPYTTKWVILSFLVGVPVGLASGIFLISLEWITDKRLENPWLLYLLPVAGLLTALLYKWFGQSVEGGNNLLLNEIHAPRKKIPFRMAPLILLATLITHLFGGSVGREGTAVQMGGAIADQFIPIFRLNARDRRVILMAGLSAGFASVFGTPVAGAVFGLEVLASGRMRYDSILACFCASLIANETTLSLGIHHTRYFIPENIYSPHFTIYSFVMVLIAGVIFGLVGRLFSGLTHLIEHTLESFVKNKLLWPVIGAFGVIFLTLLVGTQKYSGLSSPLIEQAFHEHMPIFDFLGKLIFTSVTIGSGFKGGEVTPLFLIGATLGNTLSNFLTLPIPLLAGMGFVAVFAGAANIPITCTLLSVELFGAKPAMFCALACVVSYLFSGQQSLYTSQRIVGQKELHFADMEEKKT